MTNLYLLEPDPSPVWFPFYGCRPICELRAGVWLIRERWEAVADGKSQAIFGNYRAIRFCTGWGEDRAPSRGRQIGK